MSNINSNKLKVMMITARADYGGGPEHLLRLLEKLYADLDIYVACPKDIPYWEKYANLIGEDKLIEIPHRKFTLSALFNIINVISSKKINIIHSHGKGAGIYSRFIAMLTSAKCVHTFHGLHIQNYGGIKKRLYKIIEKFLSLFTEVTIAVSQSEYKLLLQNKLVSQKKLRVIENAVVIPSSTVSESIFNSGKLEIVTISRFDFAKNTILLIPIIEELKRLGRMNRFEIMILGSGPDESEFKNEIELKGLAEYIVYKGFVTNTYEYLIESFCYISTSRWEGMPLGVLEAMSIGLPIIATDVVGNRDVVQNNTNGFLYNLNKPSEAADYIIKLADDIDLWRKYSNASKQIAEERFSIERMAEETKKVYLEIMNKE